MVEIDNYDALDNLRGMKKLADAIGAGGILSSGVISLSSAQLLDLANTPVEIVAAPGANKAIAPEKIISTLTFVTNAYPTVESSLIWGSNVSIHNDFELAPFHAATKASDSFVTALVPDGDQGVPKSISANVALNLKCLNLNPGGGTILSTTLANGGSGYAPGDTGLIEISETATYTVDTVDGGGAVLTYTITNPGTGYIVENGVATNTNGSGTGDSLFTLNITAVQAGDGTGTIEVFYRIVSWP